MCTEIILFLNETLIILQYHKPSSPTSSKAVWVWSMSQPSDSPWLWCYYWRSLPMLLLLWRHCLLNYPKLTAVDAHDDRRFRGRWEENARQRHHDDWWLSESRANGILVRLMTIQWKHNKSRPNSGEKSSDAPFWFIVCLSSFGYIPAPLVCLWWWGQPPPRRQPERHLVQTIQSNTLYSIVVGAPIYGALATKAGKSPIRLDNTLHCAHFKYNTTASHQTRKADATWISTTKHRGSARDGDKGAGFLQSKHQGKATAFDAAIRDYTITRFCVGTWLVCWLRWKMSRRF